MKLFTTKLTFDGKEKNATNFLFNTVTPICHVAFIFLSFRRGKKYNRPRSSEESSDSKGIFSPWKTEFEFEFLAV